MTSHQMLSPSAIVTSPAIFTMDDRGRDEWSGGVEDQPAQRERAHRERLVRSVVGVGPGRQKWDLDDQVGGPVDRRMTSSSRQWTPCANADKSLV